MLTVNSLGDNLNISIIANYTIVHEWMSFACWYSLSRNLPDAKVEIFCSNDLPITRQLFDWTKRVGIKFYFNKQDCNTPLLKVPACSVAVREFTSADIELFNDGQIIQLGSNLSCEAKEDCLATFVTYYERCGNFVTSEWINKDECPFPWADRFMTHSASANEIRILKLWKHLSQIFTTVSR